jgi:Tol biopolymer transport system component
MLRWKAQSDHTMKEKPSSVQSQTTVAQFPDVRTRDGRTTTTGCVDANSVLRDRYERIFHSAAFARSERLSKLLVHLLRAAESQNSTMVDERTLGIQVFGRSADWDTSVDPCVRVAMGRLRNKLDEYYESAGRNDPLRIVLAKGNYLPQIVANPTAIPIPDGPNDGNSSSVPSAKSTRMGLGLSLLFCSIAIVSVAVWLALRVGREQSAAFVITPFSSELGVQFSPAIAPDGRAIAYVWDGNQSKFDIYIRSIDGGPARLLTHGLGNDFYPSFSPDGTMLAFLRNDGWEGKLIVVPVQGGPEHVVATVATAPGQWTDDCGPLLGNVGPVWSPDGRELIAFDQGHFGIYAISVATGKRRQLTSDTDTSRDFYPLPSPDGRLLAYVHYVSHGIGDLFVIPMEPGAEPRQLTHDQVTIRGISWAPDGQSLLFASNRTGPSELWRVDLRNSTLKAVPSDTSEAANPAFAPNGRWLAFDNFRMNSNVKLAEIPAQDGPIQMRTIVSSLGRNREASLSPDGKRLLFTSDRSGSWQIWQSAPDGTAARQLTHLRGSLVGSVNWSPDNRHVVFDARPEGHSAIFLLDVDTGESKALSNGSAEERTPSWSPDGKQVYFSSDRDGSVSLYQLDIASGATSLLARNGFRAQATADGHWIYFSTLYAVLWRLPQGGGAPVLLPDTLQPYSSANWTVSGNDLLVLRKSTTDNSFELWKADPQLKIRRAGKIEAAYNSDVLGISSSPNSRSLLISTRDGIASDIVLRKAVHD